jgi:hypothetical protein
MLTLYAPLKSFRPQAHRWTLHGLLRIIAKHAKISAYREGQHIGIAPHFKENLTNWLKKCHSVTLAWVELWNHWIPLLPPVLDV